MARGADSKGNLTGVIFSNGTSWEEQRRFLKDELASLGMGKSSGPLVDIISQEQEVFCRILAERAERLNGQIEMSLCFYELTVNISLRILTGKFFDQDDPEVLKLSHLVRDTFDLMEPWGSLVEIIQLNSRVATKLARKIGIRNIVDICKPLLTRAKHEISQGVPNMDAGNLIDRHLAKREKAPCDSTFYGEDGNIHGVGVVFDACIGGISYKFATVRHKL